MEISADTPEVRIPTIVEVARMGGFARGRKLSKRKLSSLSRRASLIRWRRWRKAQRELREGAA